MTQQDIEQMVEEMRSMGIPEQVIDLFIEEATGEA